VNADDTFECSQSGGSGAHNPVEGRWTTQEYDEYDKWWRANWPDEARALDRLDQGGVVRDAQASLWLRDVIRDEKNPHIRAVARTLARLCGDDSMTIASVRELMREAGIHNKGDMYKARAALVDVGWLQYKVTGVGRGAVTTYALMPGDPGALPAGTPLPRGGKRQWRFEVCRADRAAG